MKSLHLFAISLLLAIGLTTVSYARIGQKLVAMDAGHSVAHLSSDISDETVVVGVPERGFATVFLKKGKKWEKQGEIIPDGTAGRFGWCVSISGNALIIGAPETNGSGAAFIFHRSGNNWKGVKKLFHEGPAKGDGFGEDVAIDRNTAIVGVAGDDEAERDSGSAYVYFREGNIWRQQAKLIPSDSARGDAFGSSVFVLGNTAVIGSNGNTHNNVRFCGAAYVFTRQDGVWTEQAKLTASDAGKADRFGTAVSMSEKTILVGAPFRDTEAKVDAGAAYTYLFDGNTWKEQGKLFPKDTQKGLKFGTGLAMTPNIALVGAPWDDDVEVGSGATYSFVRENGVWQQKEKVIPHDVGEDYHFGYSVNVDLNTVVVSAHNIPHAAQTWPHGDGVQAYVFSTTEDFGTPPFSVQPIGLKLTTFGQVKRTDLLQNFPNPFNPETWIPYRLAHDGDVRFTIYDANGVLVRSLDLGRQAAGHYVNLSSAVYWDGRNQGGEHVASGLYFYTMATDDFKATRRMLIQK
ncbi:MAG: T9SS type A sorting domain-containing protein [Candidatus Poribacteria bacterium]|nr:T9SS type A sorting domain-containing protein [Candidatus Poribacteria bacterium]MDE0504314.1 T9SS type A sorting domain-containing protein [Candidatus Poribacteria bacterium]